MDTHAAHILIVEDDASLSQWMSDYLSGHGFLVSVANRGDIAVELIQADQPDLVVLDIMLPVKNGFDVCREARSFYTKPILMMTACTEETDEVVGLELGADDYLAKPVKPRVLLARINVLLRRYVAVPNTDKLHFGDLCIDANAKSLVVKQQAISLSANEFDVLWLLASQVGKVLSRADLVQHLRGIDYDGFDRSIDIRVSRVRKKLQRNDEHYCDIKTVWGKGYLFVYRR